MPIRSVTRIVRVIDIVLAISAKAESDIYMCVCVCLWNENLHGIHREVRVIKIVTSQFLIISSTTFLHGNMHKRTWPSDGSQIDYVLIV
jgi:hypothetical protein